jgi:hypothetical protein
MPPTNLAKEPLKVRKDGKGIWKTGDGARIQFSTAVATSSIKAGQKINLTFREHAIAVREANVGNGEGAAAASGDLK